MAVVFSVPSVEDDSASAVDESPCGGRADVDARDVILLSWFLAHVEADEWAERTPRLLGVLLDGLSAHQVGGGDSRPD